ncbi:MAG: hypothetical protein QM817_08030 [Archangium sp.]
MRTRGLGLVLLLAGAAHARGIDLHVYLVGADGSVNPDVTLEIAKVRRCRTKLADPPSVTSCQSFAKGELLVINKTTLRYIVNDRLMWERTVKTAVAYHGANVVAVERTGGFDLLWFDEKTGTTTRTVELRKAEFKPPDWCGDRVMETYRSTGGQAAAVCLVLD